MTKVVYNFESLNRHGIAVEDADEVIGTGIWEEMTPSKRGNERLMFIGFDANGRLLEIGIEYFDDDNVEYVFHTQDATARYKLIFEKRGRR